MITPVTHMSQIIDDDAPVWQLCATGQYDEVNRLLSQHIVTIFDVDSAGRTLLHVSTWPVWFMAKILMALPGSSVILAAQSLPTFTC